LTWEHGNSFCLMLPERCEICPPLINDGSFGNEVMHHLGLDIVPGSQFPGVPPPDLMGLAEEVFAEMAVDMVQSQPLQSQY